MKRIIFFLVFVFFIAEVAFSEESVSIKISNIRHAYYRNETVTFETALQNNSSTHAANINISIIISPLEPIVKTLNLKAGENISIPYNLTCSRLKPGDYILEVISELNGKKDEKQFDFYISQQINPQRLSVDYWVPLNYWVPELLDHLTGSTKLLDWGVSHGFNTFRVQYPPSQDTLAAIDDMRKLFDNAVRERVNLGLKIETNKSPLFKNHPEVFVVSRGRKRAVTQDSQIESDVCLREQFVIENAERSVRESMKIFSMYPSFYQVLINSEFESGPCYSEDCINRLKAETGLDLYNYNVNPLRPPRTEDEARKANLPEKLINAVPKGGIIENDNPFYRFYMWWWKKGMGEATLNNNISDIVKEYKSDVLTWNDPFRLAPVYGGHKGLDAIGHWQYTHPDPKYTSYIETLISGAKPESQMVMPDITTWYYKNWIAPSDSGTIIIPPDIMRENIWIALSRRPDMISQYNSTTLNPLREVDNFHRDPKTFEMMTWMSENVYKPFGPLILQMERTERKAAILCSASSVLFPVITRGGYPNMAIYPFYSLLMMAHLPTDVIFDETISRYGLDQYDILFLHQCETITRDVYEKVLEFKKHGGIVIGDKLLRADIPLDYRCEFNLDHRKSQLADLMVKGEGVTADEDRELMTKYSSEIRRVLDGKADRFVDSDSPEVIFNVLKSGPVKYIFVINDKRTYGERYGQIWKTIHEKGVEQSVSIRVKGEKNKAPVIYNIREHTSVPVAKDGNTYNFTTKLGPCDATIIAVYPNPIQSVKIECPEIIGRENSGIISISVLDSEGKRYGSQPIYVNVTDPSGKVTDYTDYYATTDGIYRLEVLPAVNDQTGNWVVSVRDLTSGLQTSSKFKVK